MLHRRFISSRRKALFAAAVLSVPFAALAEPVLFVTQTPVSRDFTNVVAVFGNHQGSAYSAPRGGDLYIRYDDGTLRNLTMEAGFGTTTGAEIAVRDPCVHWDGEKALFSMVVGGTTQNNTTPVYFQIYEATGILQGQTVTITKLPQEENYNNISPIYGTDDRIIFTTDRPVSGDRRLYPQLDEYESSPTNTGLWRMNADGTGIEILDHCPSGDFSPSIDSFGRIIFTRWDHLQRDQQADADIDDIIDGVTPTWGARTYPSEESDTFTPLAPTDEIFPERRVLHPNNAETPDPVWDYDHQPDESGLRFNHFFPWMLNEDGTELETLNHIGRHELFGYTQRSRNHHPDHNVAGPTIREAFLQVREDPTNPGYYFATACPEFATHAAGQIVALDSPPDRNADDIRIEFFTHEETDTYYSDGQTPSPDHVGMFRDPMPRPDGTLWAAHSTSPYADDETVSDPGPPNPFPLSSRYDFRIRRLEDRGDGVFEPTAFLTAAPIMKSISYFDNNPYRTISYDGPMWELQPVSVAARTRPTPATTPVPEIEQGILEAELDGAEGIQSLRQFLIDNNLAIVVSRDVTVRADRQQDYHLKIAGSDHQTTDGSETPKELAYMQFFEGLQRRDYAIRTGRRILPTPMDAPNPPMDGSAPVGTVALGADGSMAAFVPAGRAMSWQLLEPDGTPAIRERYWLTFAPGEIRSCKNCHGLNREDVFGDGSPTNEPEAFVELLQWWKASRGPLMDTWLFY